RRAPGEPDRRDPPRDGRPDGPRPAVARRAFVARGDATRVAGTIPRPMKKFRDEVVEKLSKAAGMTSDAVDRLVDVPDLERGDFAFPCFSLAKERKAPPPRIATEIA